MRAKTLKAPSKKRAGKGAKPVQTYAQKVAGKEANIFSAAQKVFEASGYDGLRMSAVAAQAGVAEGTVYSYFASKDDLIRALVADYWRALTRDARAAISRPSGSFLRLEALAQFHIDALLARYHYAELTITLGRQSGSVISLTDEVRAYVRIFDEVFAAAQDRGEIEPAAQVWMARDMFYGSLEYSARTLQLRAKDSRATQGVVENLMHCLHARYGAQLGEAAAGPLSGAPDVLRRLEAVTAQLVSKLES